MRVHVVLWCFCAARLAATLYKIDGITKKEHYVDVMKDFLKSAARKLKAGSSKWTITPTNKRLQGATKPRYSQSPDLSPLGFTETACSAKKAHKSESVLSLLSNGIDHNQATCLWKTTQNIWPKFNHKVSTQPKTLLLLLVGFFWSNYPDGLSGLLQLVALSFDPIASLNLLPGYFLQQYHVASYKMGLCSLYLTVCTHLRLFASLSSTGSHCSQLICSFSNLILPSPPSNCTLFNTPATCRYDSTYPTSQTQQSCSI